MVTSKAAYVRAFITRWCWLWITAISGDYRLPQNNQKRPSEL